MAIRYDDLPRDTNGHVQGAWRVLHADQHFHGELGVATIRNGESTSPIAGRGLSLLAANFGEQLFIEPWGTAPVPSGWSLPPCVAFDVPPEVKWTPERCPWREPSAAPAVLPDTLPPPPPEEPAEAAASAEDTGLPSGDALAGLPRSELEALAEALGVEVDGRWGDKRLRKAIREAQA